RSVHAASAPHARARRSPARSLPGAYTRAHSRTPAWPENRAAASAPRKPRRAMSSPPEGKLETKAGHPPAVKAGGMRIVQKHPHTGDTKEEKDKDDQEWESPSPPKPTVFISGVIARGDKDFPPAAAQVAHQKPHASMDKHPSPRTQHIQQPRKRVLLC
ncbi:hypothetical protein H8959_021825, partial [Pygathrix nigripes]